MRALHNCLISNTPTSQTLQETDMMTKNKLVQNNEKRDPHANCNCRGKKQRLEDRTVPRTAKQLLGWCESHMATVTFHKKSVTLIVPTHKAITQVSLGAAIRVFISKNVQDSSPYAP